VALDELFSCLGGINGALVGKYTIRDNRIWLKGLPICIEIISAHNPDSLRSYGINGFVFDEAAVASREAVMGNLRQRVADRSIMGKPAWGIYCTTPKWKNWFYHDIAKRAIEGLDPDYKHIQFRTIGNLASPTLVEEAKRAKHELSPEMYRREYEGSFESATGLVFPSFDRDVHVVETVPPKGIYNSIGVDYGFSSDPGVAAAIRFTDPNQGYNRKIWVHSEQVHRGMLIAPTNDYQSDTWTSVITKMINQYNVEEVFCDDSRPDNTALFVENNIPALSAWGNFEKTLSGIDKLLTTRRLCISSKCQEIIDNFETWEWNELTGKPKRGNDHGIDAIRYGLSRFFDNEDGIYDSVSGVLDLPRPSFYGVRNMEF